MKNKPAFPRTQWTGHKSNDSYVNEEGMALLDYFAAKAMQSLIITWHGQLDLNELSETSFKISSAMLNEREKEKNGK